MSDLKIKQCSKALLLFIKNPVLGKVKTRLAASVGNEMALEIYKKLLKHTRSIALEVKDLDRCLYYDQWIEEHDEWDMYFCNFEHAIRKMEMKDKIDQGKRKTVNHNF